MRGYRKRSVWRAIFLSSIIALEGPAYGAKARESSSGALVQAGSFSPRCAALPHLHSLIRAAVIITLESSSCDFLARYCSYACRELLHRKQLSTSFERRYILGNPSAVGGGLADHI